MKKRIIAIAAVVCLLLNLNLTAGARGIMSSKYIDSITVYLWALGNSKMTISIAVDANDIMSEVGISSLVIEKSKSINGPWSVSKTWECNGSTYYNKDAESYTGSFSFTGTPGYYYRARTVGYAKQTSTQGDETAADSYVTKCT